MFRSFSSADFASALGDPFVEQLLDRRPECDPPLVIFRLMREEPRCDLRRSVNYDDLLAVRPEVRAGRFADARADPAVLARLQVQDEDLVEGVAGVLFLGLEDDLPLVGRKIALAGPDEISSQLPGIFQMDRFFLLPIRRRSVQD